MNTWVVNASPLILLGKIHRLDLLAALSPSFVIPTSVYSEIIAGPGSDPAKTWIQSEVGSGHVIANVSVPSEIISWDLGAGESVVLAYAAAMTGRICVLDDKAARNCAEVFRLPVIGTLGILLKAKIAGSIPSLKPEIDRLIAVGSLLSTAIIRRAITLADENH